MISKERCATLLLLAVVVRAVASKALPQSSGTALKPALKAGFENAVNVNAVTYLFTSTARPATVIESDAGIAGPDKDDGEVEDNDENSDETSPEVDNDDLENGPDEGNDLEDANTIEDGTDKDNVSDEDSAPDSEGGSSDDIEGAPDSESGSSDSIELDSTTEKPRRWHPCRPGHQWPGHGRMGNLAQLILERLERRRAFRDRGRYLGNLGRPFDDGLTDMENMLSILHDFDK